MDREIKYYLQYIEKGDLNKEERPIYTQYFAFYEDFIAGIYKLQERTMTYNGGAV